MAQNVVKRGSKWYAILWDKSIWDEKKQKQGKQVWHKLPASIKTARDAAAARRKLQEELEASRLGLQREQLASEKSWLDWAALVIEEKTVHCSEAWPDVLEGFVKRFKAAVGDVPAGQVTEEQCREYVHQRAQSEKASGASTRRKEFTFLRAVFRRAGCHCWDKIRLPAEPKGKVVFLTEAQFHKLILKAPSERAFRYQVLAYTGVRRSEAWKLAWRDINFERRSILVTNAQKGEGTKYAFRKVPICDILLQVLRDRHAELLAEKRKETGDEHPEISNDLLFPRQLNWRRDLLADCRRAKITEYTIHDLRHTYCSWLAQSGVSLHQIRDLAGHESITTTERYAHLCPEVNELAIKALDEKYCRGIDAVAKEAKIVEMKRA